MAIQIIPANNRRSTSDRFADAFGDVAGKVGSSAGTLLGQHYRDKDLLHSYDEILSQHEGDPEAQKLIKTHMQLRGHPEQAKSLINELQSGKKKKNDTEEEDKNYNFLKDFAGEKTADLYRAAPTGGKTKIIEHVIDTLQRGGNVEETLKPHMKEADEQDKGLTPKEKAKRQGERYSQNLPLYQEANARYQSLGQQREHLEILKELSPGLTGIGNRLNINPSTGDLLVPAAASPEIQRYVKTINDFTTTAKDSYGARVTNFDLQQFMRRLPTLANSEEGRDQILEQMGIITEINELREKSLIDTIDTHGGIRNIDYDSAERIADKSIKGQVDNLRSKLKGISSRMDREYSEKIKEIKSDSTKNKVAVQKADGSMGYIPKEKLSDFLKIEGNKAL